MKLTLVLATIVCLLCVVQAAEVQADPLRLIAFSETNKQWLTQSEIEKLMINKVNFMDVTDYEDKDFSNPIVALDPIPVQPKHKILVDEYIKYISIDKLTADLNQLTTFNTRYYTSTTGADAAKWILSQFVTIIGDNTELKAELYPHTWLQSSVIATIPGRGPHKDQVVIIGGHEDSVGSSATGRSPGADDDGTGTVTVIEVFRILVEAGFHPDRTLQFITYAGEEAGLLGSQAIANAYRTAQTPVHAVLQLDMTGYGGEAADIAIIGDFVDANLTSFVKVLVDTYSELGWADDRCGYACSDHASWTRAGFRSSFPHEAVSSNPYIHTANDLVSHLSFYRIAEFAKVAIGFAVELADVSISP